MGKVALWPCGDKNISNSNVCQCGGEKLRASKYTSPVRDDRNSGACELFNQRREKNNGQYDCLSRSDEDVTKLDNSDRMKPCALSNFPELCHSQILANCKIFNNDLMIAQGELCVGSQQQCYFPEHQSYEFNVLDRKNFSRKCSDSSYLIFETNTRCNS